MAADAKLLLDSLLRADSSSFNLLLESVEHSQALQDKSVAREWITKVNTLLSSNQDRWMGICLLGCLFRQCDSELFVENCLLWLKTLARLLQQVKQNVNLCKYIADILEKMLSFSLQFSELTREISSSVIPSLLTAMLNEKDLSSEVSLLVIKSCIQYYPSPTGSFWKRIESLLLQTFNMSDHALNQVACSCFAMLPNCSNPTGTNVDKQTASWEIQWRKILSTLCTVLDDLYKNFETESPFKVISTALDFNTIPVIEPQRTGTCVFRIKCMLMCLDLMLRNGFSKFVNIPVESTMKVLQRILAVNGKSIINHVAIESVLLKSSLPIIHMSALNFLSTFIESCNTSLLLYHQNITKILLLELSWSKTDKKNRGFQQTFSGLRSVVYECLQLWMHVTGSIGEQTDSIKKIIRHLIDDVKPQVATTKLLAPTTSSSKNIPHGKKAKRRRMQDDISQLTKTQQKIDHFSNADLCVSGLKALNIIISKASSDIPSDTLKEVQVFVVTLLLECQQVSVSSSSPHSSYPVPYGSSKCRKLLYQLLQSLLHHHNPSSPPPVQHAVRIFSQGIQDQSLEVSMFCSEAQMLCHVLIHPRVPVLASSLCLAHEQETVNQRYNKPAEVNNINNQESVEMELGSADNGLLSTCKTTEEINNYSGERNIASSQNSEKDRETARNSFLNSLIRKESNSIIQNKDVRDPVELVPGFGPKRADPVETTLPDVTAQVIVNEKTRSVKSSDNISKDPNKDTNMNSPGSSAKNVNEISSDAKNSLPSGREASPVNEDSSCPPVKKRKANDINCNSMEEEAISRDGKYKMGKHTDKQTSKEIMESDEEEAKTMIASFVDSVPDSD